MAHALTRPEWGGILAGLQAAQTYKVRPTKWFNTAWDGLWSEVDKRLAEAVIVYEKSLCGGCGHSLLRTGEKFIEGHLTVKEHWCEGCVQLGRYRRAHPNPPEGLSAYVVDDGK
ncbi:hypothetical protein [Actinotignum urinale]|uniref:hypothetical protein n=1 Tax=Actinotignum urinale TaxID=190146 RepID=UPI00040A7812|nr:hypothetical protein [Actinotignum urinale]MDY5159571.1 hypothetical protein [Actinotignum urinale]